MKIPSKHRDAEMIDLGPGEDKLILFEVPDDLHVLVEIHAKAAGMSMEQYLKWAVMKGLGNGKEVINDISE